VTETRKMRQISAQQQAIPYILMLGYVQG